MAGRILIVDDYPNAAEILRRWLNHSGREIRTASDGLQALETAEQFLPHVILLDIDIPKLSGFEVAQRIRQQPWGRNTILIGLTGWVQSETRVRADIAGFDALMFKPLNYSQLSALVGAFFQSNQE
jgi:DNA-binding response OmpR family regulator